MRSRLCPEACKSTAGGTPRGCREGGTGRLCNRYQSRGWQAPCAPESQGPPNTRNGGLGRARQRRRSQGRCLRGAGSEGAGRRVRSSEIPQPRAAPLLPRGTRPEAEARLERTQAEGKDQKAVLLQKINPCPTHSFQEAPLAATAPWPNATHEIAPEASSFLPGSAAPRGAGAQGGAANQVGTGRPRSPRPSAQGSHRAQA